jgi:putative membrane protein
MAVGNDVGDAALPSSSELALDRTLLAHDRALLALVRTATPLIDLGAIYKFFQYLREQQGLEPDGRVLDPRRFAMLMISIGLAPLPLATIRQLRLRKKLKRIYPEAGFSLAPIIAAFISLLGTPALVAVILRQ